MTVFLITVLREYYEIIHSAVPALVARNVQGGHAAAVTHAHVRAGVSCGERCGSMNSAPASVAEGCKLELGWGWVDSGEVWWGGEGWKGRAGAGDSNGNGNDRAVTE